MRKWLALFLFFSFPVQADNLPTLVVVADQSIALAVTDMARNYVKERKTAVSVSFVGARETSEFSDDAVSTDVLITAKPGVIESVKQQGMADFYSEKEIAHARLALVGNLENKEKFELGKSFPIATLINAMKNEPRLIVANPQDLSEGGPSREALRNMGASADLEPYIQYIKDAGQMVEMISQPNSFGIMLASDALMQKKRITLLSLFPQETHAPIAYKSLVLAGDNMDEARKFVSYLISPPAKIALRARGFDAP